MQTINNEKGFTLIEALVAMVILVIGILSLYTMQTTSVKGNATAFGLTSAATWATERIERLFTDTYGTLADNTVGETSPDGRYTVTWDVEPMLTPLPGSPEAYVKGVKVMVVRKDFGVEKRVEMQYYKQKTF